MITGLLEEMLKNASYEHENELAGMDQYELLYKNLITTIESYVSEDEFLEIEEKLTPLFNLRSEFMYKKGFKDGFKIKEYLEK